MTNAVEEILALAERDDPMAVARADIEELQIAAMRQRFADQRESIRALARRAEEKGITVIDRPTDIVPLLFSHTVYKSYPESLVAAGRWDHMLTWFGTVSALSTDGVDVDGVTDVDEWVARLEAGGHFVLGTSGTNGKSSFLDQSANDVDRIASVVTRILGWPDRITPAHDRVVAMLMPSEGPTNSVYLFRAYEREFARPDLAFAIDEPLSLGHLSRMATMRQAMALDTVAPKDIAAMERDATERARRMAGAMTRLADAILDHRQDPQIIKGLWSRAWAVLERARERGIPAGGFHPETFTEFGGGLKGASLPDDYREQLQHFFAPARAARNYGMAEISTTFPMCESGRYHCWPWNTLFVLDESGERLAAHDGRTATGRVAVYDPIPEGRWGGLVGGDRVTVDFGACQCGRPGPSIEDTVVRYSDLNGEDDKLTCSGSVEAYIRGVVGE